MDGLDSLLFAYCGCYVVYYVTHPGLIKHACLPWARLVETLRHNSGDIFSESLLVLWSLLLQL